MENEFINEIVTETLKDGTLTPRSLESLQQLARAKRLILVFNQRELVGWACLEPLTKTLSELGFAYIKPEHRRQGGFEAIVETVAKLGKPVVMATYNQELMDYGVKNWGIEQVSLLKVAWLSRGKFITKRLDRQTRNAVRQHLSAGKPLYAYAKGT